MLKVGGAERENVKDWMLENGDRIKGVRIRGGICGF